MATSVTFETTNHHQLPVLLPLLLQQCAINLWIVGWSEVAPVFTWNEIEWPDIYRAFDPKIEETTSETKKWTETYSCDNRTGMMDLLSGLRQWLLMLCICTLLDFMGTLDQFKSRTSLGGINALLPVSTITQHRNPKWNLMVQYSSWLQSVDGTWLISSFAVSLLALGKLHLAGKQISWIW